MGNGTSSARRTVFSKCGNGTRKLDGLILMHYKTIVLERFKINLVVSIWDILRQKLDRVNKILGGVEAE